LISTAKTSGRSQLAAANVSETWVAFAEHDLVEDYLKLGWMPSDINGGLHETHHGQFSIIVEWLCACPILVPKPARAHRR
jgi:hypothetical protein